MNIIGYLTSTLCIIGVAVGDWEESSYHRSRYENRGSFGTRTKNRTHIGNDWVEFKLHQLHTSYFRYITNCMALKHDTCFLVVSKVSLFGTLKERLLTQYNSGYMCVCKWKWVANMILRITILNQAKIYLEEKWSSSDLVFERSGLGCYEISRGFGVLDFDFIQKREMLFIRSRYSLRP